VLQLLFGPVQFPHLLAQLLDLVLQPLGLGLDLGRLGAIAVSMASR
jgi:hypothetical protein